MPVKTLAAGCMAMTLAWAVQAQTAATATMYPAVCVDAESLSKTVDEFQELPFARGVSNSLGDPDAPARSLVIFMNPNTQTWTIVERVNPDQYCIMAVGSGFEPVPTDIRDRVEEGQRKGQL